jgi:hypothetical protein
VSVPANQSIVVTPTPPGWAADGTISSGEYSTVNTYAGGAYEIHWKTDAMNIFIGLKVKTGGWVAVGLGAAAGMNNADLIFGYVSNNQIAVSDQFSTGQFGPHQPDTVLGGSDNIQEYGGKEDSGITVIEFKRQLDTSDRFDARLAPGKNNIIWAYGFTDNIQVQHGNRGYGEINF